MRICINSLISQDYIVMRAEEKKDSEPWYEKWFGDHYLHVYAHRDEDEAYAQADLIARLFPPETYPEMLDVCCGEGRYARVFNDKGYSVTGTDLSSQLIQAAQEKSPETIHYRICDMRDIIWRNRFDIAVNLFTSFGYFDDEDQDRNVFKAVHASLKTGGCFWVDLMNREYIVEHMKPASSRTEGLMTIEEKRSLSPDGKRIIKDIIICTNEDTHTYRESVRMYTEGEIGGLMEDTGFEVIHTFGDYDGSLYTKRSPRLICAGRKKPE